MSDVPKNWASASIAELTSKVGSGATPLGGEAAYKPSGIPLIRSMNVVFFGFKRDGLAYLDGAQAAALDGATVEANDVLLNITGASIGRVTVAPADLHGARVNQHVCIIRPKSDVDYRYLNAYLSSPNVQGMIWADNTGTTRQALTKQQILGFEVPLAPKAEQKRIADKLDTVLTRVDAVNTRLARVAPLLKRFRQSVLAAATSGRLTEDWRNTNPCNPDQAQAELNAIRSEQFGKLKVRGEAARVDEEKLFSIPPGWAWALNHQLAKDHANAICAGPFGTIFKAKDFRDSGVPIIFLRHVGEGRYMTHKPGFMDVDVWREHHQPYSVNGGELLVTKLGDPPGTACIYPNGIGAAMVTPDVLKMEVNEQAADTTYLMHFFNSPNSKQIIEDLCFGVTRLRIDIAMFKTFPIPLPPREEQTEIVRRVETLFAFADRLEARLAQAQTAATRLTPALLAKAFRGELVPQDPNDEPAAELLRRLQAERASAPKASTGRGRKAVVQS